MKFQIENLDLVDIKSNLLAVFAWKEEMDNLVLSKSAQEVDKALGGMLSQVAKTEKYEAETGKILLIHTHNKLPAQRILLIGLGKLEKLTMFDWQTVNATIGRQAKSVSAKSIAIVLDREIGRWGDREIAQGLVEGLELGTYTFNKFKNQEVQNKESQIEEVSLVVSDKQIKSIKEGVSQGEIVSSAVNLARNLVNEPPGVTTPTYLADSALDLAKKNSEIEVEVLSKPEMKELGMGGLLGIAQGSPEEPKFIKLVYNGSKQSDKTVAIVGKGITFDTGGLSLKTGDGMETMKMDMAGAAAVLAVFSALPKLKPKINVVGLISATENMPSGTAIKPGDIVRAMNGKTIEILNTDAEGRVVLADALSYASIVIKPDVIIDLATLTGACMVALGEDISGLFSNTPELAQKLKETAEETGEKVWELPLAKEYKELIKSKIADVKNITGKRYGGAITAALFLEEFVPCKSKTAWAHLDIAGPAFAEKDSPLTPWGGTGAGVRLLIEYIRSLK